jgi:hypothetical protein
MTFSTGVVAIGAGFNDELFQMMTDAPIWLAAFGLICILHSIDFHK